MLKRFTQNKEYLFVACVVLLMVIGYHLAFKKTIEAWQINRQLQERSVLSADLSYQPDYQFQKNANLDKIISRYSVDTLDFRNTSLSTISGIAEKYNVKLSEVPARDQIIDNQKSIVQKLTFEGDYFSLTKTLSDFQNVDSIGFLRSIVYRTKQDRKESLFADMYLISLKR